MSRDPLGGALRVSEERPGAAFLAGVERLWPGPLASLNENVGSNLDELVLVAGLGDGAALVLPEPPVAMPGDVTVGRIHEEGGEDPEEGGDLPDPPQEHQDSQERPALPEKFLRGPAAVRD